MTGTRKDLIDTMSARLETLFPEERARGVALGRLINLEVDKLEVLAGIGNVAVLKAALDEVLKPKDQLAPQGDRAPKRLRSEGDIASISKHGRAIWEDMCRLGFSLKMQNISVVHSVASSSSSSPSTSARETSPEAFELKQDVNEDRHSDSYFRYLQDLFQLPADSPLTWLNAGPSWSQLLTYPSQLGRYREIRGNTDVAVVTEASSRLAPHLGLCLLFELKKTVEPSDLYQALAELLLANLHSQELRPVVVLTDLRDDWNLLFLNDRTAISCSCGSRARAVSVIRDIIAEASERVRSTDCEQGQQQGGGQAGSGGPAAMGRLSSLFTDRKALGIIKHSTGDGDGVGDDDELTRLSDFEGLLPEEELREARAHVILQRFMRLPVFSKLQRCNSDSKK